MLGLAFAFLAAAPPQVSERPLAPESVLKADAGPLEALVETSAGSFVIRLLSERAPQYAARFVKTARRGGYDGAAFHRVVPGKLLEAGDPQSRELPFDAELLDAPLKRGAVAAGKQFQIALSDLPAGSPHAVFGEVLGGFAVLDAIARKPEKEVVIRRVTIRATGAERTQSPKP